MCKCKQCWQIFLAKVTWSHKEIGSLSGYFSINPGELAYMPNPEITQSPLDRRAVELYENVTLLEVQVESATSHLQGKKKALKDLPAANDRRGKVCTFAIPPATIGPIVKKPLVTTSTLASSRKNTQNYWPKLEHYSVNWKSLNKSMRKLKATTKYLPLPANELSQVSLLSRAHGLEDKTPWNTWIVLPWIGI